MCYKSQAIICMHDCLTRLAMHVLKINKQDFSSANADDSQCSHLAVLLEAWRINRNDIDDCPKGSRSRSREHKNLRLLQNSHRILENFTKKHSKTLSNDIQCSILLGQSKTYEASIHGYYRKHHTDPHRRLRLSQDLFPTSLALGLLGHRSVTSNVSKLIQYTGTGFAALCTST